jgi:formylglycine-generating enzyme required for sulfatase activity
MVWIPGGSFRMGSDHHYPEEGPAHDVNVEGFWMDVHAVNNEQFAAFVAATGYSTVCEQQPEPAFYPGANPALLVPGSAVFQKPRRLVTANDWPSWWTYTPGACWYHPEGPESNILGREQHPVVHVTYEDALAYAHWAGKDLPTEVEWERAARGMLAGAEFCWGDEQAPEGRLLANYWQGSFPWQNLVLDGFEGTAPVGSFPPNDFGLYDMAGNVWEWTQTHYTARHVAPSTSTCCAPENPRGAKRKENVDFASRSFARRVLKGGSFLCAQNYCYRYRPAARIPETVDTSTCHVGFRCVVRPG